MTEERRKHWMAVFECRRQKGTPELDSMLNEMLQQEHIGPSDIANDPEFEKFMQALADLAFSKEPKPPIE